MKHDIKNIFAFITFANSKNIVEAADKLQISQPALSAHLKNFEESLPFSPFMMQGRKKILTPYGQDLYEELNDKVAGLDDLIHQISLKHGDHKSVTLRVGGRREILSRILKSLPFSGRIIALDCSSEMGNIMLQKAQLDLLITQEKPDSLNLIAKAFFKDQFQILLPRKIKIKTSQINQKLLIELRHHPFLSYKKDNNPLQILEQKFLITEEQKKACTFSDWSTLIDLCEKQVGWTISPTSFFVDETKCQKLLVPESLIPATQFYLIYPKELAKTKWFLELVTRIRTIF